MKTKNHGWAGAVLCALLVTNAGCYSTWDLSPKSLAPLNGFHEPAKVSLKDADGSEFEFDHSTQLTFEGSGAAPAKFSSIWVSDAFFNGTARPDGHPVGINLQQVRAISAKKFSALKTALAIGIPLAVVLIIGIIGIAVGAANGAFSGGGGCDTC
jgi:hypothetical protein